MVSPLHFAHERGRAAMLELLEMPARAALAAAAHHAPAARRCLARAQRAARLTCAEAARAVPDTARARHYCKAAHAAVDDLAQINRLAQHESRAAYLDHGGSAARADDISRIVCNLHTTERARRGAACAIRARSATNAAYEKRGYIPVIVKEDRIGNLLLWEKPDAPAHLEYNAALDDALLLQFEEERERFYEYADISASERDDLQAGITVEVALPDDYFCALFSIDY